MNITAAAEADLPATVIRTEEDAEPRDLSYLLRNNPPRLNEGMRVEIPAVDINDEAVRIAYCLVRLIKTDPETLRRAHAAVSRLKGEEKEENRALVEQLEKMLTEEVAPPDEMLLDWVVVEPQKLEPSKWKKAGNISWSVVYTSCKVVFYAALFIWRAGTFVESIPFRILRLLLGIII